MAIEPMLVTIPITDDDMDANPLAQQQIDRIKAAVRERGIYHGGIVHVARVNAVDLSDSIGAYPAHRYTVQMDRSNETVEPDDVVDLG